MTTGPATTDLVPTDVTALSSQPAITPARAWQAARLPVILTLVIVVVGSVIAVGRGGARGGLLDPQASRVAGGQALARLLEDRGVEVTRVPSPTDSRDVTTFIPVPELLAEDVDPELLVPRSGRDVVIIGAGDDLLALLRQTDPGLDVRAVGDVDVDERRPACALPLAVAAGTALTGGIVYRAPDGEGCYASRGRASVVDIATGGGRLRLVGAPDLFINDRLDEEGNAALALGLLSTQPSVEWVYPRASERPGLEGEPRALLDLLPDVVVLAAVQLAIAAAWVGLWRARRLGPVVVEPLPVIVRAAESVEGRAGLYRAGRARERAADALQTAQRRRLALALGLGVRPEPAALVAAIAARTTRDASAVETLLYGQTFSDDAALVRLAHDLDTLDGEVRTL